MRKFAIFVIFALISFLIYNFEILNQKELSSEEEKLILDQIDDEEMQALNAHTYTGTESEIVEVLKSNPKILEDLVEEMIKRKLDIQINNQKDLIRSNLAKIDNIIEYWPIMGSEALPTENQINKVILLLDPTSSDSQYINNLVFKILNHTKYSIVPIYYPGNNYSQYLTRIILELTNKNKKEAVEFHNYLMSTSSIKNITEYINKNLVLENSSEIDERLNRVKALFDDLDLETLPVIIYRNEIYLDNFSELDLRSIFKEKLE